MVLVHFSQPKYSSSKIAFSAIASHKIKEPQEMLKKVPTLSNLFFKIKKFLVNYRKILASKEFYPMTDLNSKKNHSKFFFPLFGIFWTKTKMRSDRKFYFQFQLTRENLPQTRPSGLSQIYLFWKSGNFSSATFYSVAYFHWNSAEVSTRLDRILP